MPNMVGSIGAAAWKDARDRDASMASAGEADAALGTRPLGEVLCDASDDSGVDFAVLGAAGDINTVKASRLLQESGFRAQVVLAGRGAGGKSGNCALREELRALTGLRQVPVVFDVRAGRQVSASAHMCTHVSERAHRVPRCQRADTRACRRVPARRAWQDPVGGLAALVKHLEEANAAVEMGGMAGAAARMASGPSIGGVRL